MISLRGLKRIARQTKDAERAPKNQAISARARPNTYAPPKRIARTGGGGIPGASYSGSVLTPGTGTITFLAANASGGWTLGSETATGYNIAVGASYDVGPNKIIMVCWIDGRWVVDFESCT